MFENEHLIISIIVFNISKHTLLKDCRDILYLIEKKNPIPQETSSSFITTGARKIHA